MRRFRLAALVAIAVFPLILSCDDTQPNTGCEPLNLPPGPEPSPTGAERALVWACAFARGADSVFGQGGEVVWRLRLGARRDVQIEGRDAGGVTRTDWNNPTPDIVEIIPLSPTQARLSTRAVGKVPPPNVRACGFGDNTCLMLWTLRVVPSGMHLCSERGTSIDRIEVSIRP